jgi:hypothetical protein
MKFVAQLEMRTSISGRWGRLARRGEKRGWRKEENKGEKRGVRKPANFSGASPNGSSLKESINRRSHFQLDAPSRRWRNCSMSREK